MTQVSFYLDDEVASMITENAKRAGMSKSKFVSDLIRRTLEHENRRQKIMALAGIGRDIADEDWPDFDAIRRESNESPARVGQYQASFE